MTKRLFDIIASILGLILLGPLMLVIALLIRIKMKGRIFFRQERTGLNGRIFRLIKFRTMTENKPGPAITIKGDSRITPFGRVLRKYKLDELPELWNVLKGDMSFVGPRPDLPEYTGKLKGRERDILKLRPGITGPATLKYSNEEELLASVPDPVRFNNEVIFPDKVRINLEYYNNNSLLGDIGYILKTIFRKY